MNAVRPGHFKIWPLLVLGLVTCFYFRSPGVWAQPGAEDATFVPGFLQHGLVYAVALQTNGNIVVSGDFVIGLTRPRLARLQPSGALDRSFNIGDGANADVQAILVQPDQRILVAGAFTRFNRTDKLYLARLLPDGSVDASFAPDSFFSFVNALAVQPDGKILVGGARGLYRLLPDGKVDPAFAPTLRDFAVTVLALLPDGKILANGPSPDAHRLKRLNPDGSMDTNFVVEVSSVEALAVQPDSKLLVVGKFDSSATLVRRFLADGPPDPGFAPVTLRSSYAFPPTTLARTIFSLPDGKAIVAGEFYYVNDLTRGGIARLNADGSLDADFDTLTGFNTSIYAVGLQSDRKLLVGGNFRPALEGTVQSDKPLVRLLLDSDTSFSGRLEFADLQVSVGEGQGQVSVTVQRTGGSAGSVSAQYYVKGPPYGSATPNQDYTPVSGTVVFGAGETNKSFAVPIVDNNILEATESFFVGLSNLTGGAILGSQYQSEVVIADDDAALELTTERLYGLEGGPAISVNVVRRGNTNSSLTLDYLVRGGTAVGGPDFALTSGQFTFAPGQTNKTFVIQLVDDGTAESAEQATVVIQNVVGKATLGTISNAVVTIRDDDAPGSLIPRFAPDIAPYVNHVLALPNGGMLVARHSWLYSVTARPQLLQLSADGTLAREFDNSRFLPGRKIDALALQADGRVLVSVPMAINTALLRFNPDGTVDPTFQPPNLGYVNNILVQADGKILVTGSPSLVARLTPNGAVDRGFFLIPNGDSILPAMALQADGKILLSRQSYMILSNSFIRLTSDGFIDTSFASDVTGALGRGGIEEILVRSDESILVIGGFRVAGGLEARQLRRLDRLGKFTTGLPVAMPGGGASAMGEALGKIIVATLPGSLFRVNADLSADSSFTPAEFRPLLTASLFSSLALSREADGNVLAGGSFDAVSDIPRAGIARIKSDDGGSAGMVEFTTNAITLNEANTTMIIGIRRTGGTRGRVSVNYGAAEQTASPGTDFVPMSGVVTFADGEAGEKVVSFSILDDQAGEGDEVFQLTLANPIGGVSLGPNAACRVTIIDNDTTVEFASLEIKVFESVGTVPITIIRKGLLSKYTSVILEVADGTAKGGEDFILPPTTIDFAPGESQKVVNVFVVDDPTPEPDEFGFVAMIAVTGAEIPPDAEYTTIDIVDDDRGASVDAHFQQPQFGWWANGSWIWAMALQPDGKILVAGHLTSVNGETTLGIARLMPDGTRDPSFQLDYPGFEMPVTALVLQPDGKILFVYRRPAFGQSIGRLNPDGSKDPSFAASVDKQIVALQVLPGSGKIVIAGRFSSVNGVTRRSIARLLSDGRVDTSFGPGAGVRGAGAKVGIVQALTRQSDGKWLIGGQFTSVDGVRRTNIARLNLNGTIDNTFNAGVLVGRNVAYYVAALAVQPNGKILVGGNFDPSPFASSRNIIRLRANGALDPNFNYGGRGTDLIDQPEISRIRVQRDSRILISGHFASFNRTLRNSVARLMGNGTLDTSFEATAWDVRVRIYDMLVQPNDEILVAGDFDDFGLAITGVARLNPGIMDFRFSNARAADGAMMFQFEVPAGAIYDLQGSADFVQWRSILLISNQTQWIDPGSGAATTRFYRAVRVLP